MSDLRPNFKYELGNMARINVQNDHVVAIWSTLKIKLGPVINKGMYPGGASSSAILYFIFDQFFYFINLFLVFSEIFILIFENLCLQMSNLECILRWSLWKLCPKGKLKKLKKIMFQKNHKNDHFRNKYTL